jgi:hypothetical protein
MEVRLLSFASPVLGFGLDQPISNSTQQSPARVARACIALRNRKWPGKAARQFKLNFERRTTPQSATSACSKLVFIASCGRAGMVPIARPQMAPERVRGSSH